MLEVGDVVYLYNDKITPSKNKYMVCVSLGNCFLCINTENRRMYECLKIEKRNNPYLEYDSYISCNALFKFEPWEVKKRVGSLGYNDLKALYNHIKVNVRMLSRADKENILTSLSRTLEDLE